MNKWRCDRPMAEKKDIKKYCDGRCAQCLCAIQTDSLGHDAHNADMPNGCGNIATRNLKVMSGRLIR